MLTISFHSFKGGACRSTTCCNTVPFLAQALNATPDRPIILIDADLDSVGITNILANKSTSFQGDNLNAQKLFSGQFPLMRSEETITDFNTNQYFKYFIPVGEFFGLKKEAVRFLGINTQNRSVNLSGQRDTTPLHKLKMALKRNNKAAAIIFDCASGEQISAHMAINNSNVLVCCMRPTLQFREGTEEFLKEKLTESYTSQSDLNVIILPTAVPISTTAVQARENAKSALGRIANQTERLWNIKKNILKMNNMMQSDSENLGIPEVEIFKWEEGILYKKKNENVELADDELRAYERYKQLAEIIAGLDQEQKAA